MSLNSEFTFYVKSMQLVDVGAAVYARDKSFEGFDNDEKLGETNANVVGLRPVCSETRNFLTQTTRNLHCTF